MLNRPTPLTRRRAAWLGAALLGISGAAYAVQAGAPETQPGASARKVEIRLALSSGKFKASPRLITALGARSSIQMEISPGESWQLDFTVMQTGDGKLQILTRPRYAGKALDPHAELLASGDSFEQHLGGADGVPALQMASVVTLLPADFKLPVRAASTPAR